MEARRALWVLFNGKVLTIRSDDLRVLASVLDLSLDELAQRIEELGVKA